MGLDFRGHGDSDHPDEVEVGAFHRDLEAMLRHLGAADLALLGHSLGAHVALHHASTHDGVRALILIDPSRGAGRTERRRSRLALLARRSYASREEAIDRYRFVPPAPNAPEALRHWVASRSVEQDAAGRWSFKFDPRWFGLPASEPPDLSRVGSR